MFGKHAVPVHLSNGDVRIDVSTHEKGFSYSRKSPDEETEMLILAKDASLLINPVEPLNKPKEITRYLLIELVAPVQVEPGGRYKIYVTFPVASGVFIERRGNYDIIDIFTSARQKYTLYGEPQNGIVCRYWKSAVHMSRPEADMYREGIMELTVKNATDKWVTVSRALFHATGMKIFYSAGMVSMKAHMKVSGARSAQTDFISEPIAKEMKKSLELYTVRKLSILSPICEMREGI